MDGNGSKNSEWNQTYIEQQEMLFQRYLFVIVIFVFGPVILVGLFGNIIAFSTFGKMVHQNATTLLLRALAFTDVCVLQHMALHIFTWQIYLYGDIWLSTARLIHPYVVAYITPFVQIFKLANVWITVIVGFHRYIVVCRPLQAAKLCTTSHAKKQVVCVILMSTAFVVPMFFEFKLITMDGSTHYERLLFKYKWYNYIYATGCFLAFYFFLPLCMLLFFYVRIIAALRVARRQPLGRQRRCSADFSQRVSSMLIVLLGIFLLTHATSFCHGVLRNFLPNTLDVRIPLHYTYPIAQLGITFNSSVNCSSSSSMFISSTIVQTLQKQNMIYNSK